MYGADALLDVHERTQRVLAQLMDHCAGLPSAEFDRELPGFGYPTVRLQLHHVIGAEAYWVGVLEGRMDVDEDAARYPSVAALEAWRSEVAAATRAHLHAASPGELDTPRRMLTWGGREQMLMPARVILRTQTHVFHHQGQIVAMCRLLGRPAGGLDFPLG